MTTRSFSLSDSSELHRLFALACHQHRLAAAPGAKVHAAAIEQQPVPVRAKPVLRAIPRQAQVEVDEGLLRGVIRWSRGAEVPRGEGDRPRLVPTNERMKCRALPTPGTLHQHFVVGFHHRLATHSFSNNARRAERFGGEFGEIVGLRKNA